MCYSFKCLCRIAIEGRLFDDKIRRFEKNDSKCRFRSDTFVFDEQSWGTLSHYVWKPKRARMSYGFSNIIPTVLSDNVRITFRNQTTKVRVVYDVNVPHKYHICRPHFDA